MMMPFCTATPNSAMNPTAERDVECFAGDEKRNQTAQSGERHDAEDQQRLPQLSELGVEQQHHDREHEAEDQR